MTGKALRTGQARRPALHLPIPEESFFEASAENGASVEFFSVRLSEEDYPYRANAPAAEERFDSGKEPTFCRIIRAVGAIRRLVVRSPKKAPENLPVFEGFY